MHTLRSGEGLLREQALLDAGLKFVWALKAIAHRLEAYVEGQGDHKLAVEDEAATLDNVNRHELEGSRVVNLLEVSGEVACVVVLPFDESGD